MYKFRFVKIKKQKRTANCGRLSTAKGGTVREKRLLKCRRLRQTAGEMSFLDNIQLSHSSM